MSERLTNEQLEHMERIATNVTARVAPAYVTVPAVQLRQLVREHRELEAALSEACNRWEWFAQRFSDRIGGRAAADEHDYPRIAELRKLAGAE